MKRKSSFAALLAAILMCCCSSCVKEHREDCPCTYVLELGEIDLSLADSIVVAIESQDGFNFEKTISSKDFQAPLSLEVPRKGINVCVVSCDRNLFQGGKGLLIPQGEDCPPVYLFSHKVDTHQDIVRDTVRLHKNYCRMTLQMSSEQLYPDFEMAVLGSVCGYDVAGEPLKGTFNTIGIEIDATKAIVNLPRQVDASLRLQMLEGGKLVREFALGEYIASSGFDWTQEDLGNLEVTVNFALVGISLKVEPWSESYEWEVEI